MKPNSEHQYSPPGFLVIQDSQSWGRRFESCRARHASYALSLDNRISSARRMIAGRMSKFTARAREERHRGPKMPTAAGPYEGRAGRVGADGGCGCVPV